MNRRINHLSQVLEEMRDRYGPADPVVLQLKDSLEQCKATEPLHPDTAMPFGERRSAGTHPSYWNVKLRHPHHRQTRSDILAQCQRFELKAFQ